MRAGFCQPNGHVGDITFVADDNEKETRHDTVKPIEELPSGFFVLSRWCWMFFRVRMPKSNRMPPASEVHLTVHIGLPNMPHDSMP